METKGNPSSWETGPPFQAERVERLDAEEIIWRLKLLTVSDWLIHRLLLIIVAKTGRNLNGLEVFSVLIGNNRQI